MKQTRLPPLLVGIVISLAACSSDSGQTGKPKPDAGAPVDVDHDVADVGAESSDTSVVSVDAGTGDIGADTADVGPDMPVVEVIGCAAGDETGVNRGAGTLEDPFVICSAEQLLAMDVAEGLQHVLGADIQFVDTYDGALFDEPFRGTLDGQGFAVDGLTIASTRGNVGMFHTLSGTVKNLRLINVAISSDGDSVGAVAGRVFDGEVRNVSVQGTVGGRNFVGGITGRAAGELVLENITFDGVVNGRFEAIGGVAGEMSFGDLRGISVTADVLNLGADDVGGIVGVYGGGTVDDVHFNGVVVGRQTSGGLVGRAGQSTFKRVSTQGTLRTGRLAGGIVGAHQDPRNVRQISIENSFSTMAIEALDTQTELHIVGGFVGDFGDAVTIRDSYFAGTFRAADLDRVTLGGPAGQPREITCTNCFVAAQFELQNVTAVEVEIIAPNTARARATNFWWDVDLSGQTECHPEGNPANDSLDCNAANADGSDPTYFSVPTNEPHARWDFSASGPWTYGMGPYPVLR